MTLLSPPYALGAAGQVLSGKMLRLAEGAAFRNAATGVQGVSGILHGPAGTMGELTLNSNTSLTISPFRAVVQQTQDVTQGQYLVANDAAVTATTTVVAGAPTMPAQDASQFRRAYVLTYVADSQVAGVASSATTDRAVLDILPGALAATSGAAAYPVIPANALLLGELLIPPTGQAVTLTPYNPRTTTRGGILPVIADGTTITGHDGAPPTADDQYRSHPTLGLQRGKAGAWVTVADPGAVPLTALAINGLPSSFSADATNPPGFRKLGSGLIVAEGRIAVANLAFGLGQAIFTFPAGARPGGPRSYALPMGTNMIRLDVAANGVCSYGAGLSGSASSGSLALDQMQFYAVN